ncbi:MAG: hypothetical protein AB1435_01855 [Chloroflexota bacterium]
MQQKRVLSVLWCAVFAVSLLSGAGFGRAQTGVTVTLTPTEVGVAETAVVEGRIACPAGSCAAFAVTIRFDRAVARVWTARVGPYLGEGALEREALVDNAAGVVRLSFTAQGAPAATGDVLFMLEVGGLIPGEAAFTIEALDITDANGALLASSGQGTTVTVFETGKIAFFSPPDNRWEVVFTSERDGNPEIYVISADGSNPRRLTTNDVLDGGPTWSPDGARIAFHSARDGNLEIYVMNADGSGAQRLTDHPAPDSEPDWSPDGSRIVFVSERDGNEELYVMNADGSNVQRLTDSPGVDTQPAWSPDGQTIAFSSMRDGVAEIHLMNVDGSAVRRITTLYGANGWVPAYSPNGLLMTFQTERDRQADIYRMTNEGAQPLRMTEQSDRLTSTDWSPDGGWIAFMSGRSGYANLYVMDRDAQHTFRLTDEDNENYDPDWRPVFEPLPATCLVRTEFEQFARVRVGPGENRGVFGWLPAQQDFTVIGQVLDEQGKTWWQLDKDEIPGSEFAASLWVAEEEVDEIGNCLNVPPGEIPPIIPGGPPPVIVTPGGWGPCGSCDTCGGPASECVLSPDGMCLWDPKTCAPPTTGECYYLTTQVNPPGSGTIAVRQPPNCDGGYTPGSSVYLNANPNLHWVFWYWSGSCPGASGTAEGIWVTINSTCTAIANFGQVPG